MARTHDIIPKNIKYQLFMSENNKDLTLNYNICEIVAKYLLYSKNVLNNYPNAGFASNWECYYNIPSAVKSVIGGDCWVSPDLKWLFYIKNNSTAIGGYTKGLHAIKGSSALFNMTGWSGTSYTMDKEGSAIAEDCKNIYILDIKFNSVVIFSYRFWFKFVFPKSR